MAGFKSQSYPVELYAPGAVDPTRFSVTFIKRDGSTANVSGGELGYSTGPRSCTCIDFALANNVCVHMRARDRAFRRFARDYGLKLQEAARPLWAEDIRGE
jgi:hypothetical protein